MESNINTERRAREKTAAGQHATLTDMLRRPLRKVKNRFLNNTRASTNGILTISTLSFLGTLDGQAIRSKGFRWTCSKFSNSDRTIAAMTGAHSHEPPSKIPSPALPSPVPVKPCVPVRGLRGSQNPVTHSFCCLLRGGGGSKPGKPARVPTLPTALPCQYVAPAPPEPRENKEGALGVAAGALTSHPLDLDSPRQGAPCGRQGRDNHLSASHIPAPPLPPAPLRTNSLCTALSGI